jgi:hypothetical protein
MSCGASGLTGVSNRDVDEDAEDGELTSSNTITESDNETFRGASSDAVHGVARATANPSDEVMIARVAPAVRWSWSWTQGSAPGAPRNRLLFLLLLSAHCVRLPIKNEVHATTPIIARFVALLPTSIPDAVDVRPGRPAARAIPSRHEQPAQIAGWFVRGPLPLLAAERDELKDNGRSPTQLVVLALYTSMAACSTIEHSYCERTMLVGFTAAQEPASAPKAAA